MFSMVLDFVRGLMFSLQMLTFGAFTAYAYNGYLALGRRSLLQEAWSFILPLLLKLNLLAQVDTPKLTVNYSLIALLIF